MNAAHLHLVSVHVPVVGTWIALALAGSAALCRSEILFRAGLAVFLACGVAAGAAYWSGPPAWEQIEQQRAVEQSLVEDHAVIARAAFLATVVLAVLSLQILFRLLQEEPVGLLLRTGFASGLLAVCCLMTWSAALGGRISHPEIRPRAETGRLTPHRSPHSFEYRLASRPVQPAISGHSFCSVQPVSQAEGSRTL